LSKALIFFVFVCLLESTGRNIFPLHPATTPILDHFSPFSVLIYSPPPYSTTIFQNRDANCPFAIYFLPSTTLATPPLREYLSPSGSRTFQQTLSENEKIKISFQAGMTAWKGAWHLQAGLGTVMRRYGYWGWSPGTFIMNNTDICINTKKQASNTTDNVQQRGGKNNIESSPDPDPSLPDALSFSFFSLLPTPFWAYISFNVVTFHYSVVSALVF
jgi:hypothetical protein